MTGELAQVPSVSIMTERFVGAAELMCRVLGAVNHRFVVIDHPISSATSGQLAERATAAAAAIAIAVTRSDQSHPLLYEPAGY